MGTDATAAAVPVKTETPGPVVSPVPDTVSESGSDVAAPAKPPKKQVTKRKHYEAHETQGKATALSRTTKLNTGKSARIAAKQTESGIDTSIVRNKTQVQKEFPPYGAFVGTVVAIWQD